MSTDGVIGGYGVRVEEDDCRQMGTVEVDAPLDRLHGQVFLPHQCDEWTIGYGPRESVLARVDQLITDLHTAKSDVLNWER